MFDPGEKTWRDKDVVDARAVIALAPSDLLVPACITSIASKLVILSEVDEVRKKEE